MGYHNRPGEPDSFWAYDGRNVQAQVEAHVFAIDYSERVLKEGSTVLDVAAGSGALSKALLDRGFNVACTSWNAKIDLPVPTYNLDLDKPFSRADVGGVSYDLVCCIEIIEHVENPSAFLRSCLDCCGPEGTVIVSTPNIESASARLQWLFRGVPLGFSGAHITENRHISMMWGQGMEFLIECAGFSIVERHCIGVTTLNPGLKSVIKRVIYSSMVRLIPGDLRGETRLYVLAPTGKRPIKLGPTEVY